MAGAVDANVVPGIPMDRPMDRRNLLRGAALFGLASLGAATTACASSQAKPAPPQGDAAPQDAPQPVAAAADTVQQIFTAALIAEDLATTFYYHGLVGRVIQDHSLAGPEGDATTVFAGSDGNVGYLRAALAAEIAHADLMRSLIGQTEAGADPIQAFYFPVRTFDDVGTFLSILDGLENAFIGAYLAAVGEFARMAASLGPEAGRQLDSAGKPYTRQQLSFFAEVAASILGVESEHRALGRVIGHLIPANNVCYQQRSGVHSVFTGARSAVAALQHFVQPGGEGFSSTPYSLLAARRGAGAVTLPCGGGLPA